jgi:hypothetical protein
MDQMAFDLNGAINEGYRAGKPVLLALSNEGKVSHSSTEEKRRACDCKPK